MNEHPCNAAWRLKREKPGTKGQKWTPGFTANGIGCWQMVKRKNKPGRLK